MYELALADDITSNTKRALTLNTNFEVAIIVIPYIFKTSIKINYFDSAPRFFKQLALEETLKLIHLNKTKT
ncbi:MAG: hypothetical protein DIZ80_01790 [endosymbiont of Galathealinum brachiosum]|uniref:Uncharacterized protein n=1 Tax=endosymbiont of Galathealinum brachiosum TaxID=2200906 RepID=A0A370DLF8_9GAMM|nr:MAG: hypothetical protein DIZ80_01790 [endosymbiont of Galathealinum brachiosum]